MKILFWLFALSLPVVSAFADSMPDDHAPIGVMADHGHKSGEWMFSYRYEHMNMAGNRDGDSQISTQTVLNNFMVAPLEMDMDMHMFGAMYGVTDHFTVTAMAPYMRKTMQHRTRMGMEFEAETEGFGDVKLGGVATLAEFGDRYAPGGNTRLLINAGLSLPTGSIDERGDTPAGANQKLPYPMQLGSGTFDPFIGTTLVWQGGMFSHGAQAGATLRTGKNNEGYRLGNEYRATAWSAIAPHSAVSFSARLEAKSVDDVHGQDRELNPMMTPTARADLRGGETVTGYLGANFKPKILQGHRIAAEFGAPLYQRLDGPQLEQDYRFTVGWQYGF